MKKIYVFLVVTVVLLSLTGCNTKDKNSNSDETTPTPAVTASATDNNGGAGDSDNTTGTDDNNAADDKTVLHLNVANEEGNTVWFLVRVYQDDRKIAQTGILYPGEYIEGVKCEKKLIAGETVMIGV